MKKTFYYHDMQRDDFAATQNIKQIDLPADYKYVDRSLLYRIGETIIWLIALPIIWLMLKIGYIHRTKNRKVLKACKKQGYYIYGNHTGYMLDAYNPSVLTFPKRAHIIVNPDAVSLKGLGTVVKMLGAVPLPTSRVGMKNYLNSIDKFIQLRRVVMVYPEAHIWPYYTDIRPFGTQSFHCPAESGAPCFTFTNIYQKRKFPFIKRPKVLTYVDGPFYPDMKLDKKARIQKLRDEVYNAMKARVDENPKYNFYDYIYVEDESKVTRL